MMNSNDELDDMSIEDTYAAFVKELEDNIHKDNFNISFKEKNTFSNDKYSIGIPDGYSIEENVNNRDFLAWLPNNEKPDDADFGNVVLYAGQSNALETLSELAIPDTRAKAAYTILDSIRRIVEFGNSEKTQLYVHGQTGAAYYCVYDTGAIHVMISVALKNQIKNFRLLFQDVEQADLKKADAYTRKLLDTINVKGEFSQLEKIDSEKNCNAELNQEFADKFKKLLSNTCQQYLKAEKIQTLIEISVSQYSSINADKLKVEHLQELSQHIHDISMSAAKVIQAQSKNNPDNPLLLDLYNAVMQQIENKKADNMSFEDVKEAITTFEIKKLLNQPSSMNPFGISFSSGNIYSNNEYSIGIPDCYSTQINVGIRDYNAWLPDADNPDDVNSGRVIIYGGETIQLNALSQIKSSFGRAQAAKALFNTFASGAVPGIPAEVHTVINGKMSGAYRCFYDETTVQVFIFLAFDGHFKGFNLIFHNAHWSNTDDIDQYVNKLLDTVIIKEKLTDLPAVNSKKFIDAILTDDFVRNWRKVVSYNDDMLQLIMKFRVSLEANCANAGGMTLVELNNHLHEDLLELGDWEHDMFMNAAKVIQAQSGKDPDNPLLVNLYKAIDTLLRSGKRKFEDIDYRISNPDEISRAIKTPEVEALIIRQQEAIDKKHKEKHQSEINKQAEELRKKHETWLAERDAVNAKVESILQKDINDERQRITDDAEQNLNTTNDTIKKKIDDNSSLIAAKTNGLSALGIFALKEKRRLNNDIASLNEKNDALNKQLADAKSAYDEALNSLDRRLSEFRVVREKEIRKEYPIHDDPYVNVIRNTFKESIFSLTYETLAEKNPEISKEDLNYILNQMIAKGEIVKGSMRIVHHEADHGAIQNVECYSMQPNPVTDEYRAIRLFEILPFEEEADWMTCEQFRNADPVLIDVFPGKDETKQPYYILKYHSMIQYNRIHGKITEGAYAKKLPSGWNDAYQIYKILKPQSMNYPIHFKDIRNMIPSLATAAPTRLVDSVNLLEKLGIAVRSGGGYALSGNTKFDMDVFNREFNTSDGVKK